MSELHADPGIAIAAAMSHDARQRHFAIIGIKPEAARADAAPALDIGHFGDQETGTGIRQHAEMVEMPIGSDTIDRAVLAHGRDDDPVRQR